MDISPHLTTSPISFLSTSFTIPLSTSTSISHNIIPVEIIARSGEIQTSALTVFTIPTTMILSPTTLVPKQTFQSSQLVIPIPQPSATQPMPLVTLTEMPTTSYDIIAYFGEEFVVSLDDY